MTQLEQDLALPHDELKAKYKIACHLLGEEAKKVKHLMALLETLYEGVCDMNDGEQFHNEWKNFKITEGIHKY